METTEKITESKLPIRLSKTSCILKLERTDKDLHQLEKQLTSYIFEPNTYMLFIKFESIRQNLSTIKKANSELIKALKREKYLGIELFEKTMIQIRSFVEIKSSVDEYSRLLRY
jgi:hypothetical protein